MKAGSLTGLSIGYVLNDWEYNKEKEAWLLKEIDLWEVSPVTFPSNDEARIEEVKATFSHGEIPSQKVLKVSCATPDFPETRQRLLCLVDIAH